MTKTITSHMQYKNYAVENISVESNLVSNKSQKNHVDELDIDFNILKEDNDQSFLIVLFINVNKSAKSFEFSSYRISLKLLSVFTFSPDTAKEEIHKLLAPNGLAMSYSTSRGIIGELTANSVNGKYILPSVNFIELIKKKSRKNTKKKLTK